MKKIFITIILALLLIPTFTFAEITKSTDIGQIDVQANGVLSCYTVIKIIEDGKTISTTNSMTQYAPGQDVSGADQKIQTMANVVWTEAVIAQYASDQNGTPLTLEQQGNIKLKKLYDNIKYFINFLPNGFPRYDADLKMTLMNAAMTAIAAGQPKPDAVTTAENWIMTIQGIFLANKQAIADAADQTALDAIDISMATLESQYGRSGTMLADPAISTADLVSQ